MHKFGTIHILKAINRLSRALQKKKKDFSRLSVFLQCLTMLNLYICNISQLTCYKCLCAVEASVILKHRKPDAEVSVPLMPLAWAVNVLSTQFTFMANVSRSRIVHVGVLGFVAKKVPMQECLRSFFCRTHTHTHTHADTT